VKYPTVFTAAFLYLVRPDVEGAFSDDPKDPGNWTGGAVGVGELKGSKYGVSAKSYPDMDIRNVTLDTAKHIAFHDYWLPAHCGEVPGPIGFCMMDSAYNQGTGMAVIFLQRALGVLVDGKVGPITKEAARLMGAEKLISYFQAERNLHYVQLKNWPDSKRGWSRRLILTAIEASKLI
jgi:lysozyme family protein